MTPITRPRAAPGAARSSSRVFNFSAGPAMLPLPVLERIRADLPDLAGSGMSVLEISHRGRAFLDIAERAEADLRRLLAIPDDYAVLFLQGGASLQFAMVALNLAEPGAAADYLLTGAWSRKAFAEAGRLCRARIAADAGAYGYRRIPPQGEWRLDSRARYVHYTSNETIDGVEFGFIPDTGDVPLVADMSSSFLSQPIDVARFGVIYAGAQKNLGPAGLTVVIVRHDLLGRARAATPVMLDYKAQADSGSMLNTPPVFAWYAAGLVLQWLEEQGGLPAMARRNRRKADKLYAAIDASAFYTNPIDAGCRSRMNVPFMLADAALDGRFLELAAAAGLTHLKGHRSVGGMRASLYNAMPEEGVEALSEFMRDFEARNA